MAASSSRRKNHSTGRGTDEERLGAYHSIAAVLVDITAMEPKSGRVFDDTNLRVEWSRACEAVGLGKRVKQTSKSGNIWYAYEGLIVHDLRRKSEVTRRGRCSTAITLSAPMMSPTRCRKL